MSNKAKADILQIWVAVFLTLQLLIPAIECFSQDTRFDEAVALFNSGSYQNALPVFKSLAEEGQGSEMLNYYLGACMAEEEIYSDETISALLKAMSGNTPDKVFYYAGNYYQSVGEWNSALKFYNRFKNYASDEEKKVLRIDERIARCYEKSGSPLPPAVTLQEGQTNIQDTITAASQSIADTVPAKDTTELPAAAEKPVAQNQEQPVVKPDSNDSLQETELITFQVNDIISYIAAGNFKTTKGKEAFGNGRETELRLEKILAEADSLRKTYDNSPPETKKTISERIIAIESESYSLKKQSTDFYISAREAENEYWSHASENEIVAFHSEIEKAKELLNKKNSPSEEVKADPLPAIQEITGGEAVAVKKAVTANPEEIVYKVQIGSYGKTVPAYINKLYKKLSQIRKIDNYTDERGITVYTTGEVTRFGDAIRLQNQVRQEGVKDAFVVAYKNGKRIPINEAKAITEKP